MENILANKIKRKKRINSSKESNNTATVNNTTNYKGNMNNTTNDKENMNMNMNLMEDWKMKDDEILMNFNINDY